MEGFVMNLFVFYFEIRNKIMNKQDTGKIYF